MEKTISVVLPLLFMFCISINSKELYDIVLRSNVCKNLNSKYVFNCTCSVKRISRTMSLNSVDIYFQPGIIFHNYHQKIVVNKKFGTAYRSFMVTSAEDICSYNSGKGSPVLDLLKIQFFKYGNFRMECPISGRRYADKEPVSFDGFPEIVPSGYYRVDLTDYTYDENKNKNPFFLISYFADVSTTTAEQCIRPFASLVNKTWSGTKMPSIYNSNTSVGYLILNILQNTPDAITQISVDTGIELTCCEMYQKTINIASYIQQLGYKHGDIAGFITLNTDNLAAIVFACLTLGLPVNTLAPAISENEMIFFFSNTKPKLVFCDSEYIKKLERVVEKLPTICKIITVDRKVDGFEFIGDVMDCNYDTQTFIIPNFDSNSFAFILSSSGTSDNPKLVCKSHKEIIKGFTPQWNWSLASQEIWFASTNIFWMTGIETLLSGTVYGGKRIITFRTYEPNYLLEIISRYNVTTITAWPYMLTSLFNCEHKQVTSSLKRMKVSGLPMSTEMYEKGKFLFPNCQIYHAYGMTEGGLLARNLSNIKHESVGQLHINVEMKILDDDGNQLGVDEAGEIVFRTAEMFPGYFNDPVKTAETVKNGWISSGDVAYFDKDGFLFLIDRKKDMLKAGPAIASSAELELIIDDVKGVVKSCVVGVYQDVIGFDLIFAFVVKKPDSELTEKYVENYVSERVIDPKTIKGGVHFVDSFPTTLTGKVRKRDVRNWAMEKCKNINF